MLFRSEENGRQHEVLVSLSGKNEKEYEISFIGHFSRKNYKDPDRKDTISGTAFLSDIDNNRFLNINLDGKYYICSVVMEDGKLSLMAMNEHFTSFVIMSDADLRRKLSYHFRTRRYPLYDDEFSMRNMEREK